MGFCQRLMRPTGSAEVAYLLRDEFTTAAAAPVSSPRAAEPGAGSLTIVDTSSGVSLAGGKLVVVGNGVSQIGGYYGSLARVAGRMLVARLSSNSAIDLHAFGWQTSGTLAVGVGEPAVFRTSGRGSNPTPCWVSASLAVPAIAAAFWAADTWAQFAVVLRAAGAHFLYRLESESYWRLVYVWNAGNTTPMFPRVGSVNATLSTDWLRVPDLAWTPTPLASDSFDRSNSSSLGSTDGAGVEETGGSGLAWADLTGDPKIASNAFCASASEDTAATLDLGKSDVVLCGTLTARASGPGFVFRAVDSDNYFRAAIDGSNLKIWERTSGSWTERASAAASTSNGTDYFAVLALEGTAIRFMANGVAVTYTSAVRQTATVHGVYSGTTDGAVKSFGAFDRFQSGFPAEVAA